MSHRINMIVKENNPSIRMKIAEKIDFGDTILKPLTVKQNGTYEGGIEDGKQVGFNPVVVDVKPDKSAVVKQIIEFRGGRADRLFSSDYPKSTLTQEQVDEMIKYDTFENATTIAEAFVYCGLVEKYPKMNTKNVVDFSMAFYGNYALTTPPDIDMSNATKLDNTFVANILIEAFPLYDTRKVLSVGYCFMDCHSLISVAEWDLRNCTNYTKMFYSCRALEEVGIKNIKASIQVGKGDGSNYTHWGHLLKKECAIHLLYECRDTGSAKTITFSKALQPVLATVYVKSIPITDDMRAEDDLVDEKLPFEVCASTDEGATLITEYVLQKNWQVAFA